MTNSSNFIQNIAIEFKPYGFKEVKQYRVDFDTPDIDLIVHTTSSDRHAMIVGMSFITDDGTAPRLLFKSNSTLIVPWPMGSQLAYAKDDIGPTPIITKRGENLIMQCENDVIASILVCVAEFGVLGTEG